MRLYHMIKLELGHTAIEDSQIQGPNAQQQSPTRVSNAIFFGKGYSLAGAIDDAHVQLKDYITRLTLEMGPKETH